MNIEDLHEEIIKQFDHLHGDGASACSVNVKLNNKYDSSTNKKWTVWATTNYDLEYDSIDYSTPKVEGDDLLILLRCLLQNLDDSETLTFSEEDVDYEEDRERLVSTGFFTD